MNAEADGTEARLRALPSVSRMLCALPDGDAARSVTVEVVRAVIKEARVTVLTGGEPPDEDSLRRAIAARLARSTSFVLRPAINATGVVLHTGLGRSVLSESAVRNMEAVATGHSTLEIDVETGQRGSRTAGVAALLRKLVGCEDAIVANNNAAAVMLAVRSLADGREVVISRGELVEIGGQFRIPDVIAAAGGRMVEVGTTNKTHLSDYARAIGPDTAMVLHVHPSNFRIVGFTSSVPLPELAELARERKVAFMADLGSGALFDLSRRGLPGEPTVQEIHLSGVDLCTWSGDKLLGGPQCGIITGAADAIQLMKSDPMMRALRVDKLILAALEATLRLYLDPDTVCERIPTLRAISRPLDAVRLAAEALRDRIEAIQPGAAELVETTSAVGGGSLPGEAIPTAAVRVRSPATSPDDLARRLRRGAPAVFGRVFQGTLWLDLRTVQASEERALASAVISALAAPAKENSDDD